MYMYAFMYEYICIYENILQNIFNLFLREISFWERNLTFLDSK